MPNREHTPNRGLSQVAVAGSDARRTALARFFDYGGLYPPAELPPAPAAREYAELRDSDAAWTLRNFVCDDLALPEVLPELARTGLGWVPLNAQLGKPSELSFAARLDGVLGDTAGTAVELRGVEVPFGELLIQLLDVVAGVGTPSVSQVFVEVEPGSRVDSDLALVAEASDRYADDFLVAAKLRTGSPSGEAPSPAEVAAFLAGCDRYGLVAKMTAGMHHPLRHRSPRTGELEHGFLNLLAAAAFLHQPGWDVQLLEAVIAEQDPARLRLDVSGLHWGSRSAGRIELAAARGSGFLSLGTCSVHEPWADLRALGWWPS
jgi:hypothetical protein